MNNAQMIWNYLYSTIRNPYGVAAIMGNLMAESSLNPQCITGRKAKEYSPAKYAEDVQCGIITAYEFAHDSIAFGLVQWCFWSRKKGLYEYIRKCGLAIDSVAGQCGYLVEEMKQYKTVWKKVNEATSVSQASDIVMLKYEKPAGTSEAAKQKRRDYALQFYKMYCNGETDITIDKDKVEIHTDEQPINQQVCTTADKVNVRHGNGTQFGIIIQIPKALTQFPLVAVSENGWYAVDLTEFLGRKIVGWISPDFSKLV